METGTQLSPGKLKYSADVESIIIVGDSVHCCTDNFSRNLLDVPALTEVFCVDFTVR